VDFRCAHHRTIALDAERGDAPSTIRLQYDTTTARAVQDPRHCASNER
jgi:hypothetical protein